MARLRDELLAGAALPLNKHRCTTGGRTTDQVIHGTHPGTAPDDLIEPVAAGLETIAQFLILALEPTTLDGVAQHHQHLVILEGLREVVEGALLGRLDRRVDCAERGDHDNGEMFIPPPNLLQDIQSTAVGQHQVEQHGIEVFFGQQGQAVRGGRRRLYHAPVSGQQRVQRLTNDFLVVNDQNPCGCSRHQLAFASSPSTAATGSTRMNRVPCPTALSQASVPPCSCTIP